MWGTLILAGGTGRRLKENKAFMTLGNKPLLLHVLDKILSLSHETIVAIGKNDDSRRFSSILPSVIEVVKDDVEDSGPLGGILAGMQCMSSKYALVLPCDSPFVNKEVLKHLFDEVQGADAAIPRWQNGYVEPLHSFYKVSSTIPATKESLTQGQLFMKDMIEKLNNLVYVEIKRIKQLDPELLTFFNINSSGDLKKAEALLSRA